MSVKFELKRSRRRTLALEVWADKVIVRSPLFLSDKRILRFIEEKSSWIDKKIKESEGQKFHDKLESLDYLGESYRIVDGEKTGIDEGRKIFWAKKDLDKKTQIRDFYIQKTKENVDKIIDKYLDSFEVLPRDIKYKFYRSKWGSCSAKNHLSFNAYLAFAPIEVINYVVIHELCHFKIKNHSRRFWEMVASYDNNYKEHRKYLRTRKIRDLK